MPAKKKATKVKKAKKVTGRKGKTDFGRKK